jgi:uncharacterized protein DUF6176
VIRVSIRKVKPDQESRLRNWMAELTRRSAEVRETFAQEGVRHEQAFLLKTVEGAVLIYAMEAADHERAASAFRESTLPIDREHRGVMAQVLGENANVELLYDCVAE